MALNQEQFERLEAYIDGELTPAERADVEKQLVANPQLRKLMAELVATRDLLRGLPRAKAPGDLVETFQGQIERAELLGESGPSEAEVVVRIKRGPQYLAAAAIVLLALGMAGIVYKLMLPHGTPNSPFAIGRNPDELASPEPEGLAGPATRPTAGAFGGGAGNVAARSLAPAMRDAGTTRPSEGLAKELERSGVSPEDLRRARSELDAAAAPAGEPIVMLVRAENPAQAGAQVQAYFETNKIPFDTAPATQAGEAGVTGKPEGQTPFAARGADAATPALAPAPAAPVMRSRASGEAERPQAEGGGQVAERGVPEAPKDAAMNDLASQQQRPRGGENQVSQTQPQQQFAGGQQQMMQQQRSFARNAPPQEPLPQVSQQQVSQQQVAPAPVPTQGQQSPNTQMLANVANSNGVTAGRVYRAVLSQRQLRDLNTRLQSQGNQWTEFRGAVATDAIEGNPLANALTNAGAAKALNESVPGSAQKLKPELTAAAAAPRPQASAIATTLPAIVATPGPTFGNPTADAKEFSLHTSTTQPTTNPAADRESLREVLIVVNDQPIDGGGLTTATPSTQPAAAAGAAPQTQPAAAPAKPPAPAPTTPDPRP